MVIPILLIGALATAVSGANLADVCTSSYVVSKLPRGNFTGLVFNNDSVTATTYYNVSVSNQNVFPNATGLNYCNISVSYSHAGANDTVQLQYLLPDPAQYKNRFLATGGGGLAINSRGANGGVNLLHGVSYGASAGLTDGGFGGFGRDLSTVLFLANGTLNYRAIQSFAYQGVHEMSVIGKQLSINFYNGTSVYAYYFGCSEGGRAGWSQVQRYATQFNGVITGAPAFRFAYQQVNHLTGFTISQTQGYAAPPCELTRIVNDTIEFCDGLDGKVDRVVSRTDLCKIQYDPNNAIGKSYSCPAKNMTIGGAVPLGSTPAQNGTVSAQGARIAAAMNAGLYDSQGRQVYFNYQPSSTYDDAVAAYNMTSGTWYVNPVGIGVQWVQYFLNAVNVSTLPATSLTYDTLRSYILQGLQDYSSTLQTVWPDISAYRDAGGKVIHYHGESDFSIPTDSSVVYQESVRRTLYPNMTFNASYQALNDWYRLYLIPGAGHCSPSSTQPNGPFPQTTFETLINWVEYGVNPQTLNGTILTGPNRGARQNICSYPLRPEFSGNATNPQCVFPNQQALNSWYPNLNSIPYPPVY